MYKRQQVDISLEVEAIAPILTVPNKRYYGSEGYIDITAYAWDSFIDSSNLEFEWLIQGKRVLLESGTLSSTISVLCNQTGTIKGYVSVKDSADLSDSSEFFIKGFLDSDGDGNSDEWELLYNITSPDMDFDGLPNFYETKTIGTNILKWDTDDDRLSDGYSSDTLAGELTIGTDPLNNDTDADFLIDGFEWFGWNHTLIRKTGNIVVKYTSNPLKTDTDGDSLDDYLEYIYRTNPRQPDTDNDGLLDYFEIYEYGSDPTHPDMDDDGLLDSIEYEIGTHWDVSDTDDDGISDGSEYYGWAFITDPLTKDTDHDFLSDTSETFLYEYNIGGRMTIDTPVTLLFEQTKVEKAESAGISFLLTYGEITPNELLSDIRVQIYKQDSELIIYDNIFTTSNNERYFSENFDIKDLIESTGGDYYGNYVLKVIYLNTNHGTLSLETYSISVNRYLDPNDEDYDNDNIMDGVESQLLVQGKTLVEYAGSANITADTNSSTSELVMLEIEEVGQIYDADIYFTIQSNQTLMGNGNVSIFVVQKELDDRVEEKIIYSEIIHFSTNDFFNQTYHIEPVGYAPYNLYGEYQIFVDIYAMNISDGFVFTNVYTEIDGYREATSSDTEAWLTKPDMWDSDGDGWSDSYEINRNEPTNPLLWDTDGDGIKDSCDVNPFYDLILRVYFDEGHVGDLPTWYVLIEDRPILQMTVSYDHQGDYVAYATSHVRASKDTVRAGLTSLSDYKSTAEFHKYHYINIDDDESSIDLKFKLWDEGLGGKDALWDTTKMSKSYTHDLYDYTMGEKYTSGKKSSGSNWMKYEVTTLGLSRINTIAVYTNTSLFNGHYNRYERMHVFQLTVTGITLGTPFVNGLNVLLIPNSAFVKSVLNSIIQNETALESSILAKGEFMAMDREDLPESASANIESQFVITVTAAEAMLILSWVSNGLINETSGEIGIINFYVSTKLDGFQAGMMNLHPDVLSIIEIDNPYTDSTPGSMPKDAGEWWADLAAAIIKAFLDFMTALVNVLIAIAEILLAVLEFIIKAALLIFIWIVFAVSLLVVLALFGACVAAMLVVSIFSDTTIDLQINQLTVSGDITLSTGYEVGSVYNDFLGCDIPTIESYFEAGEFGFGYSYNFLVINLGLTKVPDALFALTKSITTIVSSMGNMMGISGGVFTLLAALLFVRPYHIDMGLSVIIAFGGWAAGLALAIYAIYTLANDEGVVKEALLGMGIGLIISGFAAFKGAKGSITTKATNLKDFKEVMKKYKYLSYAASVFLPLEHMTDQFPGEDVEYMIEKAMKDLYSGSLTLFIGTAALGFVWDPSSKNIAIYGAGIICLVIGIFLILQSFLVENE